MDLPVLDPPGICLIAAIDLAGSLPDCLPLFSLHLAGDSRRAFAPSYSSASMSPIWAGVEAPADAPLIQGGRSTLLIIPQTRQRVPTARNSELALELPTGHICQMCTAAVQVSIEPVPTPSDGRCSPRP
jgi:hypothetical protein